MTAFHPLDYVILVCYVAGVTFPAAGSHRARRAGLLPRRPLDELFPMVLSVIASDFFAISFLGAPGLSPLQSVTGALPGL